MSTPILQNLNVAIYCRKSQESEERQILSLPAQVEEAERYLKLYGVSSKGVFQEAKSAKLPYKRPVFSKMMSEIRKGKFNAIMCWKLDRLARNMAEAGEIIELLQREKIKAIITPFKVYDPNENVLMMAVEFGMANQYSRDLSHNVKRGQIKKARMGYPSFPACIGFMNERNGIKGERKWLVDPERFPIVEEMFQMYLSGIYSGSEIYLWAKNTAKLVTPARRKRGNKLISESSVYRMLRNPVYAGFFYLQGELYELSKELPRAISFKEHQKIVAMLDGNKTPKTQDHEVIYSGFIQSRYDEYIGPDVKQQIICDCKYKFSSASKSHCPKCGISITQMNKAKKLRYVYYRNVTRLKRKQDIRYLSETYITEELKKFINKNLVFSTNFIEFCISYIGWLNQQSENAEVTASRESRIRDLEAKKIRYRELLAGGLFSQTEYLADINIINDELISLRESHNGTSDQKAILDVFTMGADLLTVLETGESELIRPMLSRFGANLLWDEKELVIQGNPRIQILIQGLDYAKRKFPLFEPKTTLGNKDKTGVFEPVIPILCSICEDVRNLTDASETKSDSGNT